VQFPFTVNDSESSMTCLHVDGYTRQQPVDSVNLVGFDVENVWRYWGKEPIAAMCSQCGKPGARAVVTRSVTEAEGERMYYLAYVWRCLGCQNEWLDGRPILCPLQTPTSVRSVVNPNVSTPALVGPPNHRAPGHWLFRLASSR
jgi:hypothetical protein